MDKQEDSSLSSKEMRGKRLRQVREDMLSMSRRELAEKNPEFNVSQTSLHNWEAARFSGIKEKHIPVILSILKKENITCSKEWLLHGIGKGPEFSAFSNIKNSFLLEEENFVAQELRLFKDFYPDSVDAIIQDESLAPHFQPADWVGGKRYIGFEMQKALNLPSIIQTKSGETLIRVLKKSSKKGFFDLVSTNEEFKKQNEDFLEIEVFSAAPIIFWRRLLSKQTS